MAAADAALVMAAALVALLAYKKGMRKKWLQAALLHKYGSCTVLALQDYSILLAFLSVWWLLRTGTYVLMGNTSMMLAPAEMQQNLNATLHKVHGMTREEAADWLQKLRIDRQLRFLSLCSPVATILTYVVCAFHTRRLVLENVTGLPWFAAYRQDLVIQVILLPAVYATLSFCSVVRLWLVMLGTGWSQEVYGDRTWSEFVAHNTDVYLDNFAVANLAEMYTIWCFSRLCMDLLKDFIKSKEVRRTLARVTMQGVYTFVLVGTVKVATQLWLHFLRRKKVLSLGLIDVQPFKLTQSWLPSADHWLMQPENVEGIDNFLQKLLLLSSVQCLYNMMMICCMPQLADINPGLKFLGTRILIIFAQMQSALLEFLGANASWFKYSVQQVHLLHASLMCCECLGVACLHVCAWPPEDYEQGYLPLEHVDMSSEEDSAVF
uniref:Uncharacterized protein n=1 Tax=Pyrodinium bahamense TaxID=73915 RepID=A0A7S0B3G9_9DINO